MALKPRYPGTTIPYGEFDAVDSERTSYKGGEVVQFAYVDVLGSDKAAQDVFDGYKSFSDQKRLVVTRTLVNGIRPLFLVDEGIFGYGTMFGVVVGGVVGQYSVGGTVVGPHTTEGSGKLTLWDKSGIYAITLDAVDTDENVGLQPTNATLAGNDQIYATDNGILTPDFNKTFDAFPVARFLQFQNDGSLVKTSKSLLSPLNSGGSGVSGGLTEVHIYFDPNTGS